MKIHNFKIRIYALHAVLAVPLFVRPEIVNAMSQSIKQVNSDAAALKSSRDAVRSFFDDDVGPALSFTQSVRSVLERRSNLGQATSQVGVSFSKDPMPARQWLRTLQAKTKNVPLSQSDVELPKVQCKMTGNSLAVACNDSQNTLVQIPSQSEQAQFAGYSDHLIRQIRLEAKAAYAISQRNQRQVPVNETSGDDIVIVPGAQGLVTVAGDGIDFKAVGESRLVVFDERLKTADWSIFVRDPKVISWDASEARLSARTSGTTEVFVVMPTSISIIKAVVGDSGKSELVAGLPAAKKSNPAAVSERKLDIPRSLASLDGLDAAVARKSHTAGNHSGLSQVAPDLSVSQAVAQVGTTAIVNQSAFSRAKSKIMFASPIIKIVDERSNPGVTNFPLSGIRVKIAGTDFKEITNARGEVEVRDVPVGARLILEISDDRGHIFPQITEVSMAPTGISNHVAPILVTARRFSSIDFIARSAGLVQDMQKSMICGTVTGGPHALAGYAVSLDVSASVPIYFNNLGLVDVRAKATGRDGKFCFLNVEPGPGTIAIRNAQSGDTLATSLGFVAGRHHEERFNLSERKNIAITMAAVATANEQLGSDLARANRHDAASSGEVYAIGSGEMMVPMDDGRLMTGSPVLSFKGRVWVAASSADHDTTVQPLSMRSGPNQQVINMVPNGFVSDLAHFAHAIHDQDLGSVVVEHGSLDGQGSGSLKMRLVDPFGNDVGDGWYFADNPVAKAVFFNVPPGMYAVIVETESGHWLATDSVLVYSESLSYVKTGSQLERQVLAQRESQ